MLQIKKMRMPTCAEYSLLADVAKEDNDIMHWEDVFSWCQDVDRKYPSYRAVRGYLLARFWHGSTASDRSANVGFRPAMDILTADTLGNDGTIVTAGTLYMSGLPVKVPQNPVWKGDIPDYAPHAKLELREALDDPAYQMKVIRVGNVLIADRVLLKNISWNDLHKQGIR